MKKFFTKLLGLIGLVLISIILLNNKYMETTRYRHMNSLYKFENIPDKIEVANLGTSQAKYGFYYEDIDKEAFNFALPAQRLYYDLKLLEKYIGNMEEGADLILPISYISFQLGYEGENFQQFNKVYYRLLDYKEVKNSSLEEAIKYGYLPILTGQAHLMDLIDDKGYKPPLEYPTHTVNEDKLKEDGRLTSLRHLDFIREGEGNQEEFIKILDDIIRLAKENSLNPVLVVTPYTSYYYDNFPQDYLKWFDSVLDDLSRKYDTPYLDYSQDERFTNDHFFDSSHLNLDGAKLLTSIVLEDIEREKNPK